MSSREMIDPPGPPDIPDFETDRLSVRHWDDIVGDEAKRAVLAARLTEILTPAVTAHLPPSLRLEDAESWIAARAAESRCMTVTETATGQLQGLLILAASAPPDLHIGYFLAKTAWGRGLASEMVTGLVAAADRGAIRRLFGGVSAANPASAKVLLKAGFRAESGGPDQGVTLYSRQIGGV